MKASTLALLLSLSLIFPALAPSTLAQPNPSASTYEPGMSLLMPIADLVSGRVWLNLKKMDPIHTSDQYRSYAMQASGAGPVLIPYREPSPKFSRNIMVSYSTGRYPYQTEPCIAINPKNPDNIIIALDDYNFYGDALYTSIDGGESWEGPIPMKVLMRDEWGGNPALAFNREGEAYFSQMSIGYRWVRVAHLALLAEIASIVMYKSVDGGFTWSDPVVAAGGEPIISEDSLELLFLDRPWMAIGPDPEDPSRDNIYITYTEFVLRYPILDEYPYIGAPWVDITIKLVRSTDNGMTFSKPIPVSPTYSYLAGEEYHRIVQGSQSAVAPDGKLYVAFYDSLDDGPWKGLFAPTITWSTDGGLSFSKPVHIDFISELDYWVPPTFFRAWPSMSPRISVGPEGNVYTVFAGNPPGPDDADIYFSASFDGGMTWSKSKRVNDDMGDQDQVFQSIAVSGNGTIHVSFIDRRDDPVDVRYHIYYTKSSDYGETWTPNARVSDYPSNPNFGIPLFIGDFFSIAASDEDVYIAWTDTRLGRLGSPNSCIALARMRPISYPSIYISPPSGPAGISVTIMGFNFAPFRELYIEVEGALITSLLTNQEGRFTATLFIPISGEGPHTIRAMDVSGNIATATFYTEFGFDNIRKEFREGFEKSLPEIRERLASIEEGLKVMDASRVEAEVKDLEAAIKADIQGLEARLTSIEEGLKVMNTSRVEEEMKGLQADIKMLRQRLEEGVKMDLKDFESSIQGITEKLGGFEERFNAQVSSLEGILWFSTTLAIIALILSMIALALILIRYRRRS